MRMGGSGFRETWAWGNPAGDPSCRCTVCRTESPPMGRRTGRQSFCGGHGCSAVIGKAA